LPHSVIGGGEVFDLICGGTFLSLTSIHLSSRECLSKYPGVVGVDHTPDRSWALKGFGFEISFGNSSGFHAPGEYPGVPYV
jgi:hypothetical protein